MKKLRNGQTPVRKIAVGGAAAVTALGLTVMVTSPSAAAIEQDPNEDAEALGQLVQSDLLDEQLVDAAGAYSSFPSNPEEAKTPLNAEALNAIGLDLGNGVSLPIVSQPDGDGLLKLGEAGALNSYGYAPSADSAKASAGAVGKDGALNIDDINNGDYGNAEVDLTQVLGQAGLDGVTDNIVDELSLSLGAVASTAEAKGSGDASSEYAVADGVLTLSSPAVGGLSDSLNEVVDGAGGALEDVIAEEGLADKLGKAGIDINTGVANLKLGGEETTVSVETQDALNSVVENVVNEKLEDEAGIVSIDLKNGDIKIDLAKVVKGENGEDLNSLDPNTQVLTSETIGKITDAVADALGALSGKFNETLKDALNDAHAKISLPAEGSVAGIPANGKIDIDATLGQLAGTGEGDPEISTDLDVAGIELGDLINSITGPLLEGLLGVTEPIIGEILNSTADQVTGGLTDAVDPILSGLDPVFEGLNKVVDLTINEQPTMKDPAEDSNVKGTDEDGFTVNAVSLELLPGGVPAANGAQAAPQAADAVADINLASSSVRATAADEAPGDDADADDSASADADDSASADADDSASADADDSAAATADADDSASATADADDSAAANDEANASADADDSASATADADDSSAANADVNASANADDSAAATDDANAAAASNDDANASANADNDANASDDANASAAADGGDLPRTGATGTWAMGGLAALLIAGGGAAIYLTRRHRAGL
ncbi:LPXTG-motif cell wall anchor domain-containing protein [Brevibacterium sandarakinum]|uniref:LPXTG-motif cell wall anchor domain-containing protein n=1 Tax=Brevibacterium sandarakinum TaxID=629680 RepID=A0A1H1V2X4_BRESA|nr:choice-of-anchor G family protein [Brevibacterium sandarakinum]SDS79167.1 LPXTG-motif cell wall anchor domain-containing protein [Brevibacterium sandarakinum]